MQEALIGLVGGLSALLVAGAGYLRWQTRRNGSNGIEGVVKEIKEMRREDTAWRTELRPILTDMATSLAILKDRR